MTSSAQVNADTVLAATQRWLECAVIGLNLCPFAKAVHAKQQIHCVVSHAATEAEVLIDLKAELTSLAAHTSQLRETTLLITPMVFQEFLEFNAFLTVADRALRKMNLRGVIQIASFHPLYQFAGSAEDDITNFTNRAPYPVLHLLREDSVATALRSFDNPELIFEKNMQTLTSLGIDGWAALGVGPDRKGQP